MRDLCLPFPRGSTYSNGTLTMTATLADHLEARIFEVPDTEHGTGELVKLRVVRNDTGAAITAARDLCQLIHPTADALEAGRKCYAFGTDLSDHGVVAKPLDDAYTVGQSIVANDLFYVVEKGPCTVRTETVVVSLPRGTAVAADANGRINGARAAAGEYVVGTIDFACWTTSTDVVVHVNEGIVGASA